jgi:hypothetical protein
MVRNVRGANNPLSGKFHCRSDKNEFQIHKALNREWFSESLECIDDQFSLQKRYLFLSFSMLCSHVIQIEKKGRAFLKRKILVPLILSPFIHSVLPVLQGSPNAILAQREVPPKHFSVAHSLQF